MKRVGVREFRNHAAEYLGGHDVVAIERHGQPIGFYIPTGPNKKEELDQALERLEQTVRDIMDRTGMSEDELSRLFDLTEPLPDTSSNHSDSKRRAS